MNSKLEQTTFVLMPSGEIVVDTALTNDMQAEACEIGAGIASMTSVSTEII